MSDRAQSRIPHYDSTLPVKVDLVSTFSPKHGATVGESLGSEAIAGHLQGEHNDHVRVTHTDLQLDPDVNMLLNQVAETPPHILGLSVKIGATDQTREIMTGLNQINFEPGQKPLVVMGGVLPTFATRQLLDIYPNSIMALKEGENAAEGLVRVVQGSIRLDQVPGIWYVDAEGNTKMNMPRRLDLTKRHLPARQTTKRIHDELHGMIWAEASRGCDFNCTFCSIRQLHGGGFDGDIEPESVIRDMQNLRSLGIQSVSFTDDDFGGDPERTVEIARLMKEANLGMQFSISTRADHIWDEGLHSRNGRMNQTERDAHNARLYEIMQDLRDAGLVRVFLGMESGSPTQLKRYGKLVSVAGNYRAIELLHQLGIDAVAGYIPIDPLMNLTELKENTEFLRKTGMYKKITNPLSVLRVQSGSPYLKLAQNQGIVDEPTDDLVFYKAQFKDTSVQKVAELADQWVQDMYPFIFGLKGEVATVTLGPGGTMSEQSQAVQEALYGFRELEMEFIEALTFALDEDQNTSLRPIVDSYQQQRTAQVHQAAEKARAGDFGDSPRLIEVIEEFCKN